MPSTPPTTDLSRHGERPFFTARTAPHAPSKDEEEGEGVDIFRRRPYRTLSILGTCSPPAPPMLLRLTARHKCRCMHAAAHGEKADLSNYAQADEDGCSGLRRNCSSTEKVLLPPGCPTNRDEN
ncbi:unnamed protein product [Sphagnum balticum]